MTTDAGFPGLIPADGYDSGYSDEVAGYVAAGARIDPGSDVVQTPIAEPYPFTVEPDHPLDRSSDAAHMNVEKLIDRAVKKARERSDNRQPVSFAADTVVLGNMTLPDATARRILIANRNRSRVVVSNPGASTIFVGRDGGIANAPSPNVVYIPAGQSREFRHKDAVWVVGTAAGIVDWAEENFSSGNP